VIRPIIYINLQPPRSLLVKVPEVEAHNPEIINTFLNDSKF